MSDQDRYEYECEQEAWWVQQDADQKWIDKVNELIDEALNDEIEKYRRNGTH